MLEQELCTQLLKEDLDATVYFLLFQLIKQFLKKKQKPIVDLIMLGQAPQFESEKPLRFNEVDALKNSPCLGLFLRYFRTCMPANICSLVGASKN